MATCRARLEPSSSNDPLPASGSSGYSLGRTVKMIAFLRRGSRSFEFGGSVGTGVTKLAQAKDGRVWFADDGRGEVSTVPITVGNSRHEDPVVVGDGLRELLFDRDGALW